MVAKIISGTQIAKEIREELFREVTKLKEKHDLTPGLATILVGDDPASHSYVGGKRRTCETLGIFSDHHGLPADTSEDELLVLVEKLNKDKKIHGILVQLPLPGHINEAKVLYAIHPEKDVDGFLPCTPRGIQELILRSGVDTEGAEVVVVGRSNIVGKPIANILLQKKSGANATVTVCHSRSRNIGTHTKRADIVIAAIGKPRVITADMIKKGAVTPRI